VLCLGLAPQGFSLFVAEPERHSHKLRGPLGATMVFTAATIAVDSAASGCVPSVLAAQAELR
jgi:hypothetical protein